MSKNGRNVDGVAIQDCSLGKGVFAVRPFAEGEQIMWLHGRLIGLGAILQRSNEAQGYPLQISADPALFLDLEGTDAQYLNHSCIPTAAVQDTALVALQPIAAGTEITFDYSTTAAADGWVMKCRCGAPNCRRLIVSDFSLLPTALQVSFLRKAAVPSFVVRWMQHHALGVALNIPEFPRFAPFTSALLPHYRRLTGEHQVLSEFSPAGVLLTVDDPQVSVLNGNLILRSADFATQKPYFTFVGREQPIETARVLLVHAERELGEGILSCVPERILDVDIAGSARGLRIARQPERDDYLFRPNAIASGATGAIRRRHRSAERFLQRHSEAEFRILDVRQLDTRQKMLALFDRWSAKRLHPGAEARMRGTLNLAIALAPLCPMLTTAICVGDALVAVAMNELCAGGAVDHFTFSAPGYNAVPLLIIRTAAVLHELGVEAWNYQEATLRQAVFKSSWTKERYRYCQVIPA